MTYNLMRERWIRARRLSGAEGWLAPWELTDGWGDDPWVEVVSPRADWVGAIVQFLIGLLQTVCMPADARAWRAWWKTPPTADALRARLEAVAYAFELISDGGGPAFLQPLGGIALTKAQAKDNRHPAVSLCLDLPEPKKNKDWFAKFTPGGLSFEAAAAALVAYQVNAPGGGSGYRTSIRGGGPLTTLVACGTLWETVWANVSPAGSWWSKEAPAEGWLGGDRAAQAWPWLGPLRSGDAVETHPSDGVMLQVFWGMPRRVVLEAARDGEDAGVCAVYGDRAARVVSMVELKGGVNYMGPWRHPLSPYLRSAKGEVSCAKAHGGWVTYEHWCDLTRSRFAAEGDEEAQPAGVEAALAVREHAARPGAGEVKLWVFGFEFDNAKLIDWHEAKMPVWVGLDEDARELVEAEAGAMVRCALSAQRSLREAAARVLYGTPNVATTGKNKGRVTWQMSGAPTGYFKKQRFTEHADALWRATHRAFFEAVEALYGALGADDEEARFEAAVGAFLARLHREAVAIFEARNMPSTLRGVDPKVVVLAARELRRATRPDGPLMRKARSEG